jgi:pyruvate dehydrogenase E2 component (dihydrolipoamide acetyltransferase)
MPVEVIMPKVDMDMASGKVMSWHIAEGDAVSKGDPLFDIETDKAAMEVESPGDGILHHCAPEGSEIPIGQPCAWLYAPDEEVGEQPAPFGASGSAAAVAEPEPAQVSQPQSAPQAAPEPARELAFTGTAPEAPTQDKPRATPRARQWAREAGRDLTSFAGTGPRGRLQAADVLRALAEAPAPVGYSVETGPLSVTRSKGGEGTPVVMIHGFASDSTSWAPLEAHLRHRPIIRLDLPSHGKSPRLRITGFADLVKEARTALDALKLDAAHLVGHSLGGAVALALADTRPRKTASVTLIAPGGLGPDINGAALSGLCKATRPESLAPWLRQLTADDRLITDSYARLAMAARQDPSLRMAQTALAEVLFPDGTQAFDLRAALNRIEAPTRIIWGKQDAIIPWAHALRAPGRVALHLMEGVGHMPQMEATEEVGKIIRSLV